MKGRPFFIKTRACQLPKRLPTDVSRFRCRIVEFIEFENLNFNDPRHRLALRPIVSERLNQTKNDHRPRL